jgi:hypothetical protein
VARSSIGVGCKDVRAGCGVWGVVQCGNCACVRVWRRGVDQGVMCVEE